MKKIDIAMATYNGENYIEDQIKSIQNQTYENWCLYISDDGSSDCTTDLIKKCMSVDQRIKLINIERQGGVIKNFEKTLQNTNSDYIVLSDQDDLWPKNRLEILLTEIKSREEKNKDKAILVFTDLELINENGVKINDSFYKINKINPICNMKPNRLLWSCTVYGCTTIMNRKLLSLALPIPETALMHDQWLAFIANRNEGLFYCDYRSIKYRQHANNVVGGSSNSFFDKLKKFKKNLKNIKNSIINIKKTIYGNHGLYEGDNNLKSHFDFIRFAFKEIFPEIFKGDRKIQMVFLFIGFLIIK